MSSLRLSLNLEKKSTACDMSIHKHTNTLFVSEGGGYWDLVKKKKEEKIKAKIWQAYEAHQHFTIKIPCVLHTAVYCISPATPTASDKKKKSQNY